MTTRTSLERCSELPAGAPSARRARPSLLRLSFSRITKQQDQQQPRRRDKWLRKCFRRARMTLFLLSLLLCPILIHHTATVLAWFRDPTEPTTFFKTYRIGDKEILLRSWSKPFVFPAFSDETKRFIRHQPIAELQGEPRPSAYVRQVADGRAAQLNQLARYTGIDAKMETTRRWYSSASSLQLIVQAGGHSYASIISSQMALSTEDLSNSSSYWVKQLWSMRSRIYKRR